MLYFVLVPRGSCFSRTPHMIERDPPSVSMRRALLLWQQQPGNLGITRIMADIHTISVVGLLKDAEFHMIKGAAEVLLRLNENFYEGFQ